MAVKFEIINQLLQQDFIVETSKDLANTILELLGITDTNFIYTQNSLRKITDTTKKGIFVDDDKFADFKAAYDINSSHFDSNVKHKQLILPRLFLIKQYSRSNIIWLNKLGINYEDEPQLNGFYPLGLDFIVCQNRFLVVISNQDNLRILELNHGEELNSTQREILASWQNLFAEEANKKLLHSKLWDSLNLESVNKKFYVDIIQNFTTLKQYLIDNQFFDNNQAVIFTNRLLGRLLFCYFLIKKGFIPHDYFALDGQNDNDYYHNKLSQLFFAVLNTPINERNHQDTTTPYLNGGLFERKDTDIENVTFPNNYFSNLFAIFRKYNWTVDESLSNYEVMAIDPEMLGRIFENLLAEINTNDDTVDTARKAQGAFYTPRYIVDFMCKETIRQYLYSKLDTSLNNVIDKLLDSSTDYMVDQQKNWADDIKNHKEKFVSELSKITIIDPACGSGAFPMGMLQVLVDVYRRLGDKSSTRNLKLKIIENNIFGADIEPNAIEIARLRAWLSIVVDEEKSNIEPLPNLEFKFICANSLRTLNKKGKLEIDNDIEQKLKSIREACFNSAKNTSKKNKTQLKEEFDLIISTSRNQATLFGKSEYIEQLETYHPFENKIASEFLDSNIMFGLDGFDLVIGNPPYVSTKGIQKYKSMLEDEFDFADDLYNHFYFKGLKLLKQDGILGYISSNTFWTIQTKHNLRKLLLENQLLEIAYTANPFENVMVDTCIALVKKNTINNSYPIKWTNRKTEEQVRRPQTYFVDSQIYKNAINNVFFEPNTKNIDIYQTLHTKVKDLFSQYWDNISTSKNITKSADRLSKYRSSLKAGDVTLLGLVTDGGQGLATANNGKFIGVLAGTKQADKLLDVDGRAKKLFEAINKSKIESLYHLISKQVAHEYLKSLSEQEVRQLFDNLKEQYGRDIFGQGYIYKIIAHDELANLDNLTDTEKKNGITGNRTFVPYDKGDKDGNQWYLPTPFYIDWSVENVKFLYSNSGKKGSGMPVIRNPQFYFREGFCWNNVLTPTQYDGMRIKCRLKGVSVNDVASMSLYLLLEQYISVNYLVTLINSDFMYYYLKTFVNMSVNLQINDFRQLPIIIPTLEQLKSFEKLFDEAYLIQNDKFSNNISSKDAELRLDEVRGRLNGMVNQLYGVI